MEDHKDIYLEKENNPSNRTIWGHSYVEPFKYDRSCNVPFVADEFLKRHPQWDWLEGYLEDHPTQPWTLFKANQIEV